MSIPTLRPKNQVTIPSQFVALAGFRIGEALEFDVSDGAIVIKSYAPHDDWLTDQVLAEIEEAANGPYEVFSSMDELERNLDV